MLARGILGSGQTRGVSFWPFPNSSGWWWLISFIFFIRISCHKTAHANGYYGAWPGWAVSISVLPLTTPPWETSYSRCFLGIGAGVSLFCNFFLLCLGLGPPSRAEVSLPDLTWGVPYLKPAFTLVITAINLKLLVPLRDEIHRGQTGDLTGWSSLVPRNRRQHLGWGLRGLWPPPFFFFFFLRLVVKQQSCAPRILCLVWSYHPPPRWGLQFYRRAQRHCYAYFFE